jgi:hypothetical protein
MPAAKIAVVHWTNIDGSMGLVYGNAAGPCVSPFGVTSSAFALRPPKEEIPLVGRRKHSQTLVIEGFSEHGAQEAALHSVRAQALQHALRRSDGPPASVARPQKIAGDGLQITTDGPIGFDVCFSSEREAMELQLFDWER